jgi:hypothetical protein
MRIRIREREQHSRRWTTRLDLRFDPADPTGATPAGSLTLSESSDLALMLDAESLTPFEVRMRVGNVLVASTSARDRPDFLLRVPVTDDETAVERWSCSGRMLRDWVGQTELTIEVPLAGQWRTVLTVELLVTAGKIEQEAFEQLCRELGNHSAAILLDVYGKTFVGLEAERRPGEAAPLAALQRLRQTIDRLGAALRGIAHQPAYRLKSTRVREPALAEQSVSDLTLEETCVDPTLAVAYRGGIRFREHVREVASPHFDLPEHRVLGGFATFLAAQVNGLRDRARRELDLRLERRAYRHRRADDASKTWWETEDLPRIEECRRLLEHLKAMEHDLAQFRRHPFLPAAAALREVPTSTPLFRCHRAYMSAFQVLVSHFTSYRIHLDDAHLVTRAKSLPVLYEWWCLLEVLRILQGCVRQRAGSPGDLASPFRCLHEDRDRLVIELAADQAVDFDDEEGRLIRLRYVPRYQPWRQSRTSTYGLLGPEVQRTPDIAVEIFPASQPASSPEVILVFDAKYSSGPHQAKLEEVRHKYDRIGVFDTGMVLSRQVWALTPAPASAAASGQPEWACFCTVDNHGFWSPRFDMQSCVAGVVQAKPNMPAGRSPLESLLRLLLKRAGAVLKA